MNEIQIVFPEALGISYLCFGRRKPGWSVAASEETAVSPRRTSSACRCGLPQGVWSGHGRPGCWARGPGGCDILVPPAAPVAWLRCVLNSSVRWAVPSQNVSGPHPWTWWGGGSHLAQGDIRGWKVPHAALTHVRLHVWLLEERLSSAWEANPPHPRVKLYLLEAGCLKPGSQSNVSWLRRASSFPALSRSER